MTKDGLIGDYSVGPLVFRDGIISIIFVSDLWCSPFKFVFLFPFVLLLVVVSGSFRSSFFGDVAWLR